MAVGRAGAVGGDAGDRVFEQRVAGVRCPAADRPPAGFEYSRALRVAAILERRRGEPGVSRR